MNISLGKTLLPDGEILESYAPDLGQMSNLRKIWSWEFPLTQHHLPAVIGTTIMTTRMKERENNKKGK